MPDEFSEKYMHAEKFGQAIFEFMGVADPGKATREERLLWLEVFVACAKIIHGPNAFGEITTREVHAAHKEAVRRGLTKRQPKVPG
jgi:hypothetical protein